MYTLAEKIPTTRHGCGTVRFLRDLERDELEDYFSRAHAKFMERMEALRTARNFAEGEERELRFMLEALLAAKYLLLQKDGE